jgi:hypothetical protein
LRALIFLLTLFLAFPLNRELGWWDEGQMQIAHLADQRLDAPIKDKVDGLASGVPPSYGCFALGNVVLQGLGGHQEVVPTFVLQDQVSQFCRRSR